MDKFRVVEVIDGDTIDVSPNWTWNNQSGKRVRLKGVDAPELGTPAGAAAKRMLILKVANQSVELRNAVSISYGRLVCDVYLNGQKVVL